MLPIEKRFWPLSGTAYPSDCISRHEKQTKTNSCTIYLLRYTIIV